MVHFQETLRSWYFVNKRNLPWRKTTDPYKIWLSEIILQQTRVSQGKGYYLKFINEFPRVKDLSESTEQKVLSLWQGLGYYSRARNLHAASKDIMNNHKGVFPKNYVELLKLKGVGPYTAAAVASFAFNEAKAVVDGNVFRVLSRIYDISTPINSSKGAKEFQELAQNVLNKEDPATHNQAIMEFGALVCTPKTPKCNICPMTLECSAFKNNTIGMRPVKIRKGKIRSRFFLYKVFYNESEKLLFLKKRKTKDIWQNLYDFQLEEFTDKVQFEEHVKRLKNKKQTIFLDHKLSHQSIMAYFILYPTLNTKTHNSLEPVKIAELKTYPIPTLIKKYLDQEPNIPNSV